MHDVMSLDPADHHHENSLHSVPAPAIDNLGDEEAPVGKAEMVSTGGVDRVPPDAVQRRAATGSLAARGPGGVISRQQPLFRAWHRRGNPFRFLGESSSAARATGVGKEFEEEEAGIGDGIAGVGIGR